MRFFIVLTLLFCQTLNAEISVNFSSEQAVKKNLPISRAADPVAMALEALYQKPFSGRGILKKSYRADGSRTRLINELEKIPGKFAGFSRIDSVYVKSRYQWGEYTIFPVVWTVDGKQKIKWTNTVGCSAQGCGVSDLLLRNNDMSQIVNAALFSSTGNAKTTSQLPVILKLESPNSADNPLLVRGDASFYSNLDIKPNVNRQLKQKIFAPIAKFAQQIWQQENLSDILRDKQKNNAFWNQYWMDYKNSAAVTTYDPVSNNSLKREAAYLVINALPGSIAYSDQIQLLASIESEGVVYVFARLSANPNIYQFKVTKNEAGDWKLCAQCGDIVSSNIIDTSYFGEYIAKEAAKRNQ